VGKPEERRKSTGMEAWPALRPAGKLKHAPPKTWGHFVEIYGCTFEMNVPQLVSSVRGAFGMYSAATQISPLSSATAAE
jgi:hypothetical protein